MGASGSPTRSPGRGNGPHRRGTAIDTLRGLLPSTLKSRLKDLLRLPEGVLHPWRRRRAHERLGELAGLAESVLFVCYGNICRSPFAERVFEDSVPDCVLGRVRVRSTGFYLEEGRTPPSEAVRAAAKLDVDISDHRSRSLVSSQAATGRRGEVRTVVFVMNSKQKARYLRSAGIPARAVFVLGDFDPEPVERRGIPDPFGHSDEVFERVFGRIERCVRHAARAW